MSKAHSVKQLPRAMDINKFDRSKFVVATLNSIHMSMANSVKHLPCAMDINKINRRVSLLLLH